MPTSPKSTNRKSIPNRHSDRKLFFDRLEDRRLMAGNLHGQMTARVYLKAFSAPEPAAIGPTSHVIAPATQETVDSRIVCFFPEVSALPLAEMPTVRIGDELELVEANSKAGSESLNQRPGLVASQTPSGSPNVGTPVAAPSKQPLFGLKMPTLSKPKADDSTYSGEVFAFEMQNTDVSTTGEWGSAAYQGKTRAFEATGKVTLESDPSKGKLSAKAEGEANLFKTEHKGQYAPPSATIAGKEISTTKLTANATVAVGVSGSAKAGVNWNSKDAGLKAEAKVFAGIEAKADVGMDNRVLGVKTTAGADGYARAGAEAAADAGLGRNGLDMNAKAFAGAKAGGTIKSSIAGIGLSAEGEAWAGAGGEAGLTGKMEGGKFRFKASLGASPIVGGKAGFGIEVDPSEVVKTADFTDEVDELVAAIKKNEEAQVAAAKAQAEALSAAAKAQADALAVRDQILAQINNFNALANQAGSEVSNFGNNVVVQASNFGSSFVSLFG